MPFVEPITIKEAIENVHRKRYLLPAIQREFVWDTEQIQTLFDSLMRDYPINSFLFWDVEKKNVGNYQFYEFIRSYHERDSRHNPKANLNGENGIIAILDGQQRLTSLYIGLKGSYSYKLSRKRWDNDEAFPQRKLCLNLTSKSENGNCLFDFRFLTANEINNPGENDHWFIVGKILDLQQPDTVMKYLINNELVKLDKHIAEYASETLYKLWEVVHKNKSINFFLEKSDSLNKVLNIFIRVNSGGTQLSYSDLLLSIATAQWKDKDAREEITSFVDDVNSVGEGFNINKDFVLKSCLVLGGFKDIAFNVDNFNRENMLTIENKWDEISKAIKASFILLARLGYNRDTLTSNNAIIPIASYLCKLGTPDNFSDSASYQNERENIFKWLVMVILKRTFSGQPDNVLRQMREVISSCGSDFPLDELVRKFKGTAKSISFDDDEIDNLLYYQYAQPYTYSVLALIHPFLDFRNRFHQDHIFPKSMFTIKKLRSRGIKEDDIEFYIDKYNCLANLQLIEGIPNQEKSRKDFDVWIKEKYPDKNSRKSYMERNYIPNIDLSLRNFKEFIVEREKLISETFKKLVA